MSTPILTMQELTALRLHELNRAWLLSHGSTLPQMDWTWQERCEHVAAMLVTMGRRQRRPSMEEVSGVCAHMLAFQLALDQAELADVSSGEAA